MRRFYILLFSLLYTALACSVISPTTPTLSPIVASPTTIPVEASLAPQILVEETATNQPPTRIPALAYSQPAVRHHDPGDLITLDQIKMVDVQHGWAISGGDVLYTTDGAQTWREAT